MMPTQFTESNIQDSYLAVGSQHTHLGQPTIYGSQAFLNSITKIKINGFISTHKFSVQRVASSNFFNVRFNFTNATPITDRSNPTFLFNYDTASQENVLGAGTPGTPERKAGEWHLINGEYVRIGGANIDFNAGLADLTKPLKIPVEEQTSNTEKNQRTINKDNIQQIAQTAESVSALPSNPYVGQKIKPTQAINIVSPAQTLASGKTYIYNGATWDQIVALSDIPRQFRSDADVTGQKIQFSETWFGTQAQLNAYTTKEDGLYITSD